MNSDVILAGLFGLFAALAFPILILWLITATITANLATARGRSKGAWVLLALIFGPFAILLLALFPVDQNAIESKDVQRGLMKRCSFCRKAVGIRAVKCRHCHTVLAPLAYSYHKLALRKSEEAKTIRNGIRKAEFDHYRLETISKAVRLCSEGVPIGKVAEQLHVSDVSVQSWLSRYMDDDDWMQQVDMFSGTGRRTEQGRRSQQRQKNQTALKGITRKDG